MDAIELRALWDRTLGPGESLEDARSGITRKTRSPRHPPRPEPPSGDRYRVEEQIGRGGMGLVYRAWQRGLDREVAIKRMDAAHSGDLEARGRFLSEALVTGLLDHPNIVPVHDLDTDPDGEIFLAMKLVGGSVWSDLLREDRLTGMAQRDFLDRHIGILLQIGNAVAFAHSRNLIHRDLKPANVMVGDFGEVLLMDWGLAADIGPEPSPDSAAPHCSSIRYPEGTPAYMAPEIAEGEGAAMGPWTDIYLLGSVLHELVTGAPPHRRRTEWLEILAASEAVPPNFEPDVPGELQGIIRHALAREPQARFSSVADLELALRAFLQHRESFAISDAASRTLARCTQGDRDAPDRDRLYGDFATAVAGYRQSLELWNDNPEARAGVRRAALAYARTAIHDGDLGLAAAQLADLDTEDPEVAELQRSLDLETTRRLRAARTARRLKIGLATGALLFVVGLVVALILIYAARQEAERFADGRRLEDLVAEAEGPLWPATLGKVSFIESWLERARELARRSSLHRSTLEALRERAKPYDDAQRAREPEAHAEERARLALLDDIEVLEAERLTLLQRANLFGRFTPRRKAIAAEISEIKARKELRNWERGQLEAALRERRIWKFEDPAEQLRHDKLRDLVRGLEVLQGSGHPSKITIDGMTARLQIARDLRKLTTDDRQADWDRTIAGLAESPLYRNLSLLPQLGLLPLGPDPLSGLFEFAETQTGVPPARGPDGRLQITEETGLVFVLLPGGTFRLGAIPPDRDHPLGSPNVDPDAGDSDGPVHEVSLDPFFISKYEMTQGQWLRFVGENPSYHYPGYQFGDKLHDLRHPVEHVSWHACRETLRRLGLVLPTEAQWEYAARAGTTTPRWCSLEALPHCENLADQFAKNNGGPSKPNYEPWNDGYTSHAPVGTYRPNPFGLHDTLGNVWEWCRDPFADYNFPFAGPDALHQIPYSKSRTYRGGSWLATAQDARSSHRAANAPETRYMLLGLRPARAVDGLQ